MKICISTTGSNLDAPVDPRFGRAQYFLIVETDSLQFEAIPNQGLSMARGAGIASAQMITSTGVKTIITGNMGPNAFMVLQGSGIKIYGNVLGMTARQAIEEFKKGNLKEMSDSTVPGIGPANNQGMIPPNAPPAGFGRGQGGGMGGGRGRGGRGR